MEAYAEMYANALRANNAEFLEAACRVADAEGTRLVVHLNDKIFPTSELPRVMSTDADVAALLARVPRPSTSLCMCLESFFLST